MKFAQDYHQCTRFAEPTRPPPRSRVQFWCELYRSLANGSHDVDPQHLNAVADIQQRLVAESAQTVDESAPPDEDEDDPDEDLPAPWDDSHASCVTAKARRPCTLA